MYSIVPFSAKRSIVKLDEKKARKRQERWQAIAKGAAEQSGRSRIPEVQPVKSFAEALDAASGLDLVMIPYELEEGMERTVQVIENIMPGTVHWHLYRAGGRLRRGGSRTGKIDRRRAGLPRKAYPAHGDCGIDNALDPHVSSGEQKS